MKIKFSFLNDPILLEKRINILSIDNTVLLSKFFYLIKNEFEDSILIENNYKELDVKKYSIFIPSPFEININSKKNLSLLYNEENKFLSIEDRNKFEVINSEIISILEDIKTKSFYDLDYDGEIAPIKIFDLFRLRFSEDVEYDFFNYFKRFIDVTAKISNVKIIFTYDILHLLNNEEIDELEEILKKNNILILDIVFNGNIKHDIVRNDHVFIKYIDDDFCEY